jgi:hypothetical protein
MLEIAAQTDNVGRGPIDTIAQILRVNNAISLGRVRKRPMKRSISSTSFRNVTRFGLFGERFECHVDEGFCGINWCE